MKKISGLFMIALLIVGCSSKPKLELSKEEFIVELGEKVSLSTSTYLVAESNKEILKESVISSTIMEDTEHYVTDKDTISTKDKDYLVVGSYDFKITYKEESVSFTVIVKDTTSPTFVDFEDTITLSVNSEDEDITKYFKATDLSDVVLSIEDDKENPFDATKAGVYKITVVATDKYKNVTKKDCNVNVVEGSTEATPNSIGSSNQEAQNPSINNNEATSPPSSNSGAVNTPPTTNGNTSNNTPVEKPNVCVSNGQWQMVSNSGMAWYSWEDANAYGNAEVDNQSGKWYNYSYSVYSTKDNCGATGYTVSFN